MNELKVANSLMAKLYQIEEYDSLEISSELNINRLLKAKEYFQQQMSYFAELASVKKAESIRAELRYQQVRAQAKIEAMDRGSSASKAEAEAMTDINFSAAKERYADILAEYEYASKAFQLCLKKVDACQQHISILSKEEQFNKFLKQ